MDIDGLNFDDPGWAGLNGGYRQPYDPRPILRSLEAGMNSDAVWSELVTNLYHQEDVGEASYAAVPHLVRIYAAERATPLNTYSFVAMVELARHNGRNPLLPDNLCHSYKTALAKLASIGLQELPSADDPAVACYIIAVLALDKGQHRLGQFAALFDETERREILKSAGWLR